jgi:hypothetical protein
MKWNELSMSERNKYIQLAVQNGIRDIDTIVNAYEDAGSISREMDSPYQTYGPEDAFNSMLSNPPNIYAVQDPYGIQKVAQSALGYVPALGTIMDIEKAAKDPSMSNMTEAGVSVLADALGAKAIKEGAKAIRWAKMKWGERNNPFRFSFIKPSDIPKWGSLAGLAAIAADQGFNTTALRDALGQTYTDIYSGLNRD